MLLLRSTTLLLMAENSSEHDLVEEQPQSFCCIEQINSARYFSVVCQELFYHCASAEAQVSKRDLQVKLCQLLSMAIGQLE
jgi:hypothetical protein